MQRFGLIRLGTSVAALCLLTQCTSPATDPLPGDTGGTTGAGVGGTTGTGAGGATGTAGTTGTGTGGRTGGGAGGNTGAAGNSGTGAGGSTSSAGGTTGSGAGGTTTSAGGTTGGGTGGATATVDANGIPLGKPGDSTNVSKQYINLGDMRLINNRWGSDARNCTGTVQSVFVNADKTLGWSFNRPTCGGMKADPDFPEVEFGVAPFGTTSSLLTTPPFSSTTLLPIQLKNLTSASVNIDTFATTFQNPTYYDANFEFWISKMDPTQNPTAGVYAEIIAFTGWESNRLSSSGGWPCDKTGNVTAGGSSFYLCHQSDTWSNNQWRFFNFNVNGGPLATFNSKVDIKAILDWVTKNYSGFTTDMWLTRIEVGTEIDDNTQGSAKINNLTFEINGVSKSPRFGN
jgi:hypothetical protein